MKVGPVGSAFFFVGREEKAEGQNFQIGCPANLNEKNKGTKKPRFDV